MKTLKSVTFSLKYNQNSFGLRLPENWVLPENNAVKVELFDDGDTMRTTYAGYIPVLCNDDPDGSKPTDVEFKVSTTNSSKENGIIIKYTIKNKSGVKKTVRLGVYANVCIGNTTSPSLKKIDNNKLKMGNRNFFLTINDFDRENNALNTLWIGNSYYAADSLWENSDNSNLTNVDSGFAFSWMGIEIPAGGSVERSFSLNYYKN